MFAVLLFINLSPSRNQISPEGTMKLHIFFPFSFFPPLPSPSDLQDKYHNLSLLSCLACGLDDILAMPSVFPAFSSLGQTQRASEAYCMSLTFLEVQSSVVYFVKPRLMEVLLLIGSAIVSL